MFPIWASSSGPGANAECFLCLISFNLSRISEVDHIIFILQMNTIEAYRVEVTYPKVTQTHDWQNLSSSPDLLARKEHPVPFTGSTKMSSNAQPSLNKSLYEL